MSRPGTEAVFVGAATQDAIALVDDFPEPDERMVAHQVEYAGGGPAATAAVTAARLGLSSAFVGAVGDDEEGERILAGLQDESVDVSGVQRLRGRRSGASLVVVQAGRGTRAICTRPVPVMRLPAGSVGEQLVRDGEWVHVDHLGWEPVSGLLEGHLSGTTPRISVDAGNRIPGLSPAAVDLLAPTLTSLADAYGHAEPDKLLEAALADGATCVVATRGRDGASGAGADGTRAHSPGYPVEAVSTLGAGDVFHGALLSAVIRGYPLSDQLAYANVVAALSCRALDGRSAIPDHNQAWEACMSHRTHAASQETH